MVICVLIPSFLEVPCRLDLEGGEGYRQMEGIRADDIGKLQHRTEPLLSAWHQTLPGSRS